MEIHLIYSDILGFCRPHIASLTWLIKIPFNKPESCLYVNFWTHETACSFIFFFLDL